MAGKPTHVLILEVTAGNQIMPIELSRGSEKSTKVSYKKWYNKIETLKLIEIPSDLPASIGSNTVVSLRVTEIPKHVLKSEAIQKKWEGDPKRAEYMKKFIDGAKSFDNQVVNEGLDLLDQGYKAD